MVIPRADKALRNQERHELADRMDVLPPDVMVARHRLAVVAGNRGDDYIGRPGIGDLVQTTAGTWITRPPMRCPNGHEFGPNKALVGHQACLGHGGGHTTWTCRTCDQTVYGPPLNTHCTTLDGPATVRISNVT